MANIQFGGLITGLDTKTLIDGLVKAEQQTTQVLQNQKIKLQAKDAVFSAVNGALGALRGAAQNLSASVDFAKRTAESSDSAVLSASADSSATLGSHLVAVDTLAKAQTLRSTSFTDLNDQVKTGTLQINVGSDSTSITIDATNNTISGLRDAINNSGAKVTASIINVGAGNTPDYRLVIRGKETGTAKAVTLTDNLTTGTGSDPFAGGGEVVQAASDAKFSVDGLTVTRSSNTISDVISGVTFVLRSEGNRDGTVEASDPTAKITVNSDPGSLITSVKTLVDNYNAVNKLINDQFKVDPNTHQQGSVGSDSSLRGILGSLRAELAARNSSATGFHYLSDIGISFQRDGSLTLDGAKLASAIEQDTTGVANLFLGLQNGVGKRVPAAIDTFVNVTTGTLTQRQKGNNQRIQQIDDKIAREQQRSVAYQDRLTRQFSALEKIVGQLKTQGDKVAQQLNTKA